jgi:N-acetylglucosamine malate deacetylase 1
MDSNRESSAENGKEMKYLFIGAHVDDCELCCGGTMAKLIDQGHAINCLALTYCDQDSILEEYKKASEILGINYCFESFDVRCFDQQSVFIADALLAFKNYDFVFTHSVNCRHPDHRTVAQESIRIFNCSLVTFIQPWNGQQEENYFVEISEEQLEKKIQALACYRSQHHRQYMNENFIRSQAIYNGIKCGKKYAEAFRIEKMIA